MILFALFGLLGLSSLYIGSKQSGLYQSRVINGTWRLSLKIINNALAKSLSEEDRREVIHLKRVYIAHLVLLYCSVSYAFYEVYQSAVK